MLFTMFEWMNNMIEKNLKHWTKNKTLDEKYDEKYTENRLLWEKCVENQGFSCYEKYRALNIVFSYELRKLKEKKRGWQLECAKMENKLIQNDVKLQTCMLKAQNACQTRECRIEYYILDYELKKWKKELDEKRPT